MDDKADRKVIDKAREQPVKMVLITLVQTCGCTFAARFSLN